MMSRVQQPVPVAETESRVPYESGSAVSHQTMKEITLHRKENQNHLLVEVGLGRDHPGGGQRLPLRATFEVDRDRHRHLLAVP